jgi:hypothetical protein
MQRARGPMTAGNRQVSAVRAAGLAALSAVGGVSDGEHGHIIDHHDRATDEGPGHKSEGPQCSDRPEDDDVAEDESQS